MLHLRNPDRYDYPDPVLTPIKRAAPRGCRGHATGVGPGSLKLRCNLMACDNFLKNLLLRQDLR